MFFKAVAGFLLLFGLFLASFGVYFIGLGHEAEGWLETEGRVVSSHVRTETHTAPGNSVNRIVRYYPSITYEWTVDGTSYTSSRYRLGETHEKYADRGDAVAAALKFRTGSPIPVYYDEDHPKSAVLDPSLSVGVFVPLPMGLLFLICGWVLWRHGPAMEKAMAAQRTASATRAAP